MHYMDEVLKELFARLPELEWKISKLGPAFSTRNLPKGLFQYHTEYTAEMCINELKKELNDLAKQENTRSALHMANRIRQKINVLVTVCQLHEKKNKTKESNAFGIHTLSTRQQRLNEMEQTINTLQVQQQAIAKALEQINHSGNTEAILNIQIELGAVEKRLTVAKEAYQRAIA